MRGSPLFEWLLVLVLGLLLAFPLHRLTRPAPSLVEKATDTPEMKAREVWIDLRFSHPPLAFSVIHDGVSLFHGGGSLRADAETTIRFAGDRLTLLLELQWPDDVEQAYAELNIEPDGLPSRQRGVWGRGRETRALEFAW